MNPSTPAAAAADPAALHEPVLAWYARHGRDLPWRRLTATPWGVFVSEIMSHQTPLVRVEPVWREWLTRWPTPTDLSCAAPGEAVRAWGRLGYPRRAIRLHQAAVVMRDRHAGAVPCTPEDLLGLPGVGAYTAAAVLAFAFGARSTVVDTNVRRVLARVVSGRALPAPALTGAESTLATRLLPAENARAATWNVAAMELGALVCTAKAPACQSCPVADLCAWRAAGSPAYDGPPRRGQPWAGTDRQIRGRLLALLRDTERPLSGADLAGAWASDQERRVRCLDSLIAEGLVQRCGADRYQLPGLAGVAVTA
ncbi:MAG TPA: A/G-specific adenine glycosylase [Dermatophilaceae bacterium]|nr:A/G-specific adenine glycosylase [Dermatophilaceae bacterium]